MNMISICKSAQRSGKVAEILSKDLFLGKVSEQVIEGWYDQFRANYLKPALGPYMLDVANPLALVDAEKMYLGHDLPVWLGAEDASKHVMIIGQDPVRSDAQKLGELTIASPWGLHYPSGYHQKHASFMNNVVCPLVDNGIEVYLTDFWKLFATSAPVNDRKRVLDSRKNIQSLCIDYAEILKKEIELVQPDHIIIMSSNLKVALPIKQAIPDSTQYSVRSIAHVNARFKGANSMKEYYQKMLEDII